MSKKNLGGMVLVREAKGDALHAAYNMALNSDTPLIVVPRYEESDIINNKLRTTHAVSKFGGIAYRQFLSVYFANYQPNYDRWNAHDVIYFVDYNILGAREFCPRWLIGDNGILSPRFTDYKGAAVLIKRSES
jgi:hypothetical protein